MCDQTEIQYLDGDVVWVKLGSCWWPGEVVGPEKLPPDVLPSFRKPPIAVVKFFQETTYEYVKNINSIYKYNCSRKNEFINKGLYMYRTKHGHMEKFPEDVIRAETAVGGDIEILTREEFQEQKKESYAGIFGENTKKTPVPAKRGRGRGRPASESPRVSTPMNKFYKEKSDYKVHILVQPTKEPAGQPKDEEKEGTSTPSSSRAGSEVTEDKTQKAEPPPASVSTPTMASSGIYTCPTCKFTTMRLNVLILHNKTHSVTYTPYTPSPVRKKLATKSPSKSTPKSSKTPKTPRPRAEKTEKEKAPKKPSHNKKRTAEDKPEVDVKKPKTDQEIKSSLLADWDDDEVDDESTDETSLLITRSPELPVGSESPAAPVSAELPDVQKPTPETSPPEKKSDDTGEKPESSSDSKYEFCEDEDWPVEADAGRKIPRVKNPSKRKEETKSLSLDEDDVAKEVAELLKKTALPELPSVPEPLKIEENFPEPSIVKSPDKKPDSVSEPGKSTENAPEPKQTKAIFKTKTFFRSRHSRSQDAIGKYVAEQLNPERLEMADSELNGSEAVSSPEARESPPIDHVKVARLAPKIQLKKMKAEAAQLEKEKNNSYRVDAVEVLKAGTTQIELESDILNIRLPSKPLQDVIYPTQEIKPINKLPDKTHHKEENKKELGKTNNEIKQMTKIKNTLSADIESNENNSKILNSMFEESEPKCESAHQVAEDNFIVTPHTNVLAKNFEQVPSAPINVTRFQGINTFSMDTMENESSGNVKMAHKIDKLSPFKESPQKLKEQPVKICYSPKKARKEIVLTSEEEPLDTTLSSKEFPLEKAHTSKEKLNTTSPEKPVKSDKLALPTKTMLQKSYEQMIEPYMSESTASAVDALLSVSREADRVPRIVSSGPPEDLFEDDNKDGPNDDEGMSTLSEDNGNYNDDAIEQKKDSVVQELNGITKEEPSHVPVDTENESTGEIVQPCTNLENLVPVQAVISNKQENIVESTPSESDLQIAETLLNLPSTAIQNKTSELQENMNLIPMDIDDQPFEETVLESENIVESDTVVDNSTNMEISESMSNTEITSEMLTTTNNQNLNIRYETEQEKSENLTAAQSLVQMSESIDLKLNIVEKKMVKNKETTKSKFIAKQNNGLDTATTVEQKVESLSIENNSDPSNGINKSPKFETTSSKLLKILEEPTIPKISAIKTTPIKQTTPLKQLIVTGKEKILNFDVAKSAKVRTQPQKQKIIIRRTGTTGKTILNSLTDVVATPDKIILSRSNVTSQDGSSVQTFTIQTPPETITPSDSKQIIIQPKLRKVAKTPTKVQKLKPHNSLVQWSETKISNETPVTEDAMFDINSMPVVLSDDILTPENIDKMPIVMSDGIITNASNLQTPQNPPKIIKTAKPTIIENEKIAISASPTPSKPEVKTLLMNPVTEMNKVTTPNILSKSSKLRAAKPMLVIDKATGKQKIIMTKTESAVKEIKPVPTIIQSAPQTTAKAEKFIILPTGGSPRPGRTQKIVIDPQTGKAHVLVAKGQETTLSVPDNKPVSAKLIPSSSDATCPGNTVMIITNAQGAQSRIVLTPEHEKILFPNKQQPNVSQFKTITHRISTNATLAQKTVVSATSSSKTPTRIVPKQQKGAIITSKGQLIVGGRVTTTAQNIAPMPEIRPAPKPELMRAVPKRIVASEPKKLVQAIQKTTSEPLIFLQQKSGAVMQLTAAQFEHLQRTGQIIQKVSAPAPENKVVVPKSITITPKDTAMPALQKQRVRKSATASPTPAKKVKKEITIAPAPAAPVIQPPVPPLTSLSNTVSSTHSLLSNIVPTVSNTISVSTSASYAELENFEELLPSTAIVKQPSPPAATVVHPPEPVAVPQPEPVVEPPPAQLSDGQLLAVPGESFGGPPGSFYLCVEDNGTLTPIDNRPLVLENNQLVPMAVEPVPVYAPQPERQDILQAALANSDVFHAEASRDDAPDFRDLNANVSVHCRVSETSTTLNQPIMTPVEVPSKGECEPTVVPSNLEDGLAVIGVTPHTVPTSLELPITVTDPRIAPKTTTALRNSNYGTALLTSPNTDMPLVATEESEVAGPISMPLLTDEEAVGKSMPILTDEIAERNVSSVESTVESPSSLEVRESEAEEGGQWSRRLLTPATDISDTSETSAEIPLQPHIQLSVNDLSRNS